MSTVAPRNLNPRGSFDDFSEFDDQRPLNESEATTTWIVFAGLVVAILLAYLNMLLYTATFWSKDMYSHGYIIPFFAAYLFWIRKRPLRETAPLDRWIGVGVVAASLGLRVFAAYFDYNNFERASFIGALLGVCLVVGGRSMFRWAGLPIAFLAFMFPAAVGGREYAADEAADVRVDLQHVDPANPRGERRPPGQYDQRRHAGGGPRSGRGVQRSADADDFRGDERRAGDDH